MTTLTNPRFHRCHEAYIEMAKQARYRPQAPGDGMGHTHLTKEQAADPDRLDREASEYAHKFNEEENTRTFWIGCSNFQTNRAFIWTIEAARALAGGADDLALDLLKMAVKEVKIAQSK
jgi:hypothetical protein